MISNPPLVVATMLALKDLHVADFQDGTPCYVQGGIPFIAKGFYQLNLVSGAAENLGTGTVVAPGAGAPIAGAANARWLLCECVVPPRP